jgi:Glucose-6-phosphate dehydrogenase, C-terminal domain
MNDGYRSIDGVAADSTTETYAALRLDVENWRWSGVPFFIRTGKRMPVTQTELRLVFKQPPGLGFAVVDESSDPDQMVIKLDPSTGVQVQLDAHRAGGTVVEPITLDMEFAEQGGEGATPYEVLLHAAMEGRSLPFTRQDGVEEQWRIVQPLLDAPPPITRIRQGPGGLGQQTPWSRDTAAGTARGLPPRNATSGAGHAIINSPPWMSTEAPVIYAASSETRKAMRLAISAGAARRSNGILAESF